MAAPIRILAVCGSLNEASKTRLALEVAAQAARAAGAEVELLDLRDFRLPILFSPHGAEAAQAEVERLREQFQSADALLIGSPEYHGSIPGGLKNAFDLLGFDEFEGKMVALTGVAGGALGATNALNHLRVVCRQLHAWVLPEQVSIAQSGDAFDAQGRPTDEGVERRLRELGIQLVKFTALHHEAGTHAFVHLWEQAAKNPGG